MYRIMIVDDEIVSQDMIKKYITDALPMYQVFSVCSNGQDALNSYLHAPVDIILVDIHMPIMDGLTFIEHLSKITDDVVVIIVSGYSEFSYAQTAMRLGVVHYLLKPLDFKELQRALDASIQTLRFKRIARSSLLNQEDEHELYLRNLLMGRYGNQKNAADIFSTLSFPFSYYKDKGFYIRINHIDIRKWSYGNDALLTAINNMIRLLYNPKYLLPISRRINGYDFFIIEDNTIPHFDKFCVYMHELLQIDLSSDLVHRFNSLEELRKLTESDLSDKTKMQINILSREESDQKNNLFSSDFNVDSSIQTSINNAIQYMKEHYAEDLTRDMVAEAVYMSGAHFSRCFKTVTAVSYKDYLTEIRMQKAIELLKTSAKISDIAQQVGYCNPNRFNINFRHYTTYTPSEYRTFVLKIL